MVLLAEDVEAEAGGKLVLRGVSIELREGEILALMGPNGSGKTTFASAIAGSPSVVLRKGRIVLDNEEITAYPPEDRMLRGLLLLFQNPPEIPGVKLSTLLLASYNKSRGTSKDLLKVSDASFFLRMREAAARVGLKEEVLYREINVGFSGGERKRAELLQAMVLNAKYIVMDEPDSGLDVDGLRVVGEFIERMRKEGKGVLLITHYTRLFSMVRPDRIAVMVGGRIIAEGKMELAEKIDAKGYSGLAKELGVRGIES
ncbi:MAG: Fe-S cluster assembly ATPase SufC [Fervidicoccaceae archaeon]